METHLNYLQHYDESNTYLLNHVKQKRDRRQQFLDVAETQGHKIQELRESENFSLKLVNQYKRQQEEKRTLFLADQRRMQ